MDHENLKGNYTKNADKTYLLDHVSAAYINIAYTKAIAQRCKVSSPVVRRTMKCILSVPAHFDT